MQFDVPSPLNKNSVFQDNTVSVSLIDLLSPGVVGAVGHSDLGTIVWPKAAYSNTLNTAIMNEDGINTWSSRLCFPLVKRVSPILASSRRFQDECDSYHTGHRSITKQEQNRCPRKSPECIADSGSEDTTTGKIYYYYFSSFWNPLSLRQQANVSERNLLTPRKGL